MKEETETKPNKKTRRKDVMFQLLQKEKNAPLSPCLSFVVWPKFVLINFWKPGREYIVLSRIQKQKIKINEVGSYSFMKLKINKTRIFGNLSLMQLASSLREGNEGEGDLI